jgi:hypothetical protein
VNDDISHPFYMRLNFQIVYIDRADSINWDHGLTMHKYTTKEVLRTFFMITSIAFRLRSIHIRLLIDIY